MNRRFEIKLIEENLNDDLEPVEFRWWKCSRINNMGEIKETNILTIKDICKDLADFYDRNDDTSFDPYKDSILFDKDQRIAELEEENERLKKIVDKYIEELKSSMELKNITMHQQEQIDTLKKILLNGGDKNE